MHAQDPDDDDPAVPRKVQAPELGKPAHFGQAIGTKFELTVVVEPTKLEAEAFLTLKIRIVAPGTDPVHAPPTQPDLHKHADWVDFHLEKKVTAQLGKRDWEFVYTLRPKHDRVTEVPSLTWSYYWPGIGYQVKQSEAVAIQVLARADLQLEELLPSQLTSAMELAPLVRGPQIFRGRASRSWLAWLLFVGPPVVCLAWYAAWRRAHLDVALRAKQSRALRNALARLQQVPDHAPPEKLAGIVTEYLHARFGWPIAEPTPLEAKELLVTRGCQSSTVDHTELWYRDVLAERFGPTSDKPTAYWRDRAGALLRAIEMDCVLTGRKSPGARPFPAATRLGAWLSVLLLLAGANPETSDLPADLLEHLERAEAAYTEGLAEQAQGRTGRADFTQAGASYLALQERVESPDLACNAGNAWLLAGHLGRASWYYQRTLRLEPTHRGARQGLAQATRLLHSRQGAYTTRAPESYPAGLPRLPKVWWVGCLGLCWSVGWACWLAAHLTGQAGYRRLMWGTACVALLPMLGWLCAISSECYDERFPLAVLLDEGLHLRAGPGTSYAHVPGVPTLWAGTTVRVLHQRSDHHHARWYQVEFVDREGKPVVGWLSAGPLRTTDWQIARPGLTMRVSLP